MKTMKILLWEISGRYLGEISGNPMLDKIN